MKNKDATIPVPVGDGNNVVCTMEAKLCPDGSYVGRTGPNCEFAMCPVSGSSSSTSNMPGAVNVKNGQATLAVGQTVTYKDFSITLSKISEDSRCPQNVQCVWAGLVEVILTFKDQKGASSEVTLKSNETPIDFRGTKISIASVTPTAKSDTKPNQGDYRITFNII